MSQALPPHIFRAYDIRGIYGRELTERVAETIGLAFGTYMGGSGKRIIVGRDLRLSGPSLTGVLIKGLVSAGCHVIDVGVVPTPVVYFEIASHEEDGGVVCTASHNPPEWNGFKLCREKSLLVAEGLGMEKVKAIAQKGEFKREPNGKAVRHEKALEEFADFVVSRANIEKSLKVALDPGNGASTVNAMDIIRLTGCTVTAINEKPDGTFPNRSPEPIEENLKPLADLVLRKPCDFGAAYDGDGDRVVFVDDLGRVIPGDIALAVLAKYYLKRHGSGKVLLDIACSLAVEQVVKEGGGTPVVSRVGHAYMLQKMIEEEIPVGGEVSSHLYFSEIFGLDDAIYATLKLAEVISRGGRSLSELVNEVPQYPSTPVKTYDCSDERKFRVAAAIAEKFRSLGYKTLTMDGVKVVEPDGWLLIRASNTLPQIKLKAEAMTVEKLRRLEALGEKTILEGIKGI